MYVIIDTNIIIQDYFFKSQKFTALFDYLKKTPHKLILPKIVLEELVANYKQDLEKALADRQKATSSLLNLGINQKDEEVVVSKQLDEYEAFVKNFVKQKEIIVIEHDSAHFLPIISRAVNKKPPFMKGDSGFKDAIIWETVKNLASKKEYEYLAFITKNTHQFSSTTKIDLHEVLADEIDQHSEKFRYFSSLESFLEEFGSQFKDLSIAFLQEALNSEVEFLKSMNAFSEDMLTDTYEGRFRLPVQNIEFDRAEISHFFVYKADKKNLYVQAVGKAVSWVYYWDPLEMEYTSDEVTTRFEASFVLSKDIKEISMEGIELAKVEPDF